MRCLLSVRALTLALVLINSSPTLADQIVIAAVPVSRVVSDSISTQRQRLSDTDRTKAALFIRKSGDNYRWASREDRQLKMVASGAFVLFVDPTGAGYVKVVKKKGDSSLVDDSCVDGFAYFEHLSLGVATITYWGCAAEFVL